MAFSMKNGSSPIIKFPSAGSCLLSFMLATALGGTSMDAFAKKNESQAKHSKNIPQLSVNDNPNTRHCPVLPKPQKKVWGWKTASLKAIFLTGENGQYEIIQDDEAVRPDEKLPIASLTKTMAALVVIEAIQSGKWTWETPIPVLPESLCLRDSNFATWNLERNLATMTVREALIHAIKLSSNPMIYNLAVAYSGSEKKFIEEMNRKAKEWGMDDTHFMTSHGLPEPDGDRRKEYISARNVKIMFGHAIPHYAVLKELQNSPLPHWINPKPNEAKGEKVVKASEVFKERLRQVGAVFKTATIDGCASLAALSLKETYFIASVQLCAGGESRFLKVLSDVSGEEKRPVHSRKKPCRSCEKFK